MIWIPVLLIVAVFALVIGIRTARFTPKEQPKLCGEEVRFDEEAAVDALAQLVRCKTISCNDPSQEDEAEFQKLIDLLPRLGEIHGKCLLQQLWNKVFSREIIEKHNIRFDEAISHYQALLVRSTEPEAEVYWRIMLCRYGVEYVLENASRTYLPTITRMVVDIKSEIEKIREQIQNIE